MSQNTAIRSPSRNQFIRYPNPFFNVGSVYFPNTYKELYPWCRYGMSTIAGSAIRRLAVYPLTKIVIKAKEPASIEQYEDWIIKKAQGHKILEGAGKDYFCYGCSYISPAYPFEKWLTCNSCKESYPIKIISKQFKYINYQFKLEPCPNCRAHTTATAKDVDITSVDALGFMRWSPMDMHVNYNPLASRDQAYEFIWKPPREFKNKVTRGDRHTIMTTRNVFLRAVQLNESVTIEPKSIYYMKREDISGTWESNGQGVPLMLSALKDIFLLAIMQKAREAILLEHVVPLRFVYPLPQTLDGGMSPYKGVNLKHYGDQVLKEFEEWRRDPNRISWLPLPVGVQTVGGQGRSLFLNNELEMHNRQIVTNMDVPAELVFGGLQYSGSNISLRIFGNFILAYYNDLEGAVSYMASTACDWGGWPDYESAGLKPFKMADDLQRSALLQQVNAGGKCSDQTFLEALNLNTEVEAELMDSETSKQLEVMEARKKAMAEIEGKIMIIQTKYEIERNKMIQEAGMGEQPAQGQPQQAPQEQQQAPQQAGQSNGQVEMLVSRVKNLPPEQQAQALAQMRLSNPELASQVQAALDAAQGTNAAGRPLPEHLPPRRGAANQII